MPIKNDDDLWRKRIAQWIIEAPSKLSPHSCQTLARKATFKKFVSFMAEQAPGTMAPFLKRVIKKMPVATADDCNTGSKRSAAERDETRKAKKAKFEETKDFGCEVFGSKNDFERGPGAEESLFVDEEKDDQEKSTDNLPRQLDEYTASEIENGLVGGDLKIWKLFIVKFAKLPRNPRDQKDGSRVLEACKKLGSENVVTEVCRVLRTASKKPHSVPRGYDVKDARQILQTLHQIALFGEELGIHNVFVQMLLFTVVKKMIDDKQFQDSIEAISHLVNCYIRSPEGEGQIFQRVKDKYCADYNRGHRWTNIAEAFEGTGIVLAIVATGVGATTVGEAWTVFERACFEKLAEYLPGLKEVIKVLGADALKQCCQNSLPVGKIQELEQLNDPASDEDDEDEIQDNDNDSDSDSGGDSGSDSDSDD